MLRAILLKIRLKLRHLHKLTQRSIRPLEDDIFFSTHWESVLPTRTLFTSDRQAKFFFNPTNRSVYTKTLESKFIEQIETFINRADSYVNGNTTLLGVDNIPVTPPVNWQRDYKADFEWELTSSKKLSIVDPSNNADIKIPWELSRLQSITALGRAFWLTSNPKYIDCYMKTINDWEEHNPIESGTNWTCAMEVAIRAINMVWGLYFFAIDETLRSAFVQRSVKSLYYHALFIEKNLEIIANHANTNHLLSDYLGLFYIGTLFPEFDRAEQWQKIALDGLEKEIRLETFNDGANYECSFAYHRLVLEIFLHVFMLGQKNNISFSEEYKSRLNNMAQFSLDITAPSGKTPLVGDNDNGFIIKLSETDPTCQLYLAELTAIALNQPVPAKTGTSEERLWFFGPDSLEHQTITKPTHSALFKESGYAIHGNENYHLLFNCGKIAEKSLGGHKHNDLLSVTLELNKEPILIDPGTYTYTADYALRNKNRSTSSHSTVVIDNIEQNQLIESRLFYLPNNASPIIDLWISTDDLAVVSGKHTGYTRLYDKITHTRTVWSFLKQQTLIMQDDFTGEMENRHELVTTFVTPQTDISIIDNNTVQLGKLKQPLFLQFASQKQGELTIEPFEYHPNYGVKKEGRVIRYTQSVRMNHTNMIALAPIRNATRLVEQLNKTMSRLDLKQTGQRQTMKESTYV